MGGRAVVTGASGLLGSAVVRELAGAGHDVEGWSHVTAALPDGTPLRRLGLAEPGVPEAAIRAARPALVVHCAALTDVDRCEADPGGADVLNAQVPERLAAAARGLGARFVHVSTDAVYDGERPGRHAEDDPVAPANAYAASKAAGERAVLAADPDALVVRTTMHGWTPRGRRSFSEAILRGLLRGERLTLFEDVVFSPPDTATLAEAIRALAGVEASRIVNVGAADAMTKAEFGRALARVFGLPEDPIEPVRLAELALPAARPRNTALDVERVTELLGGPPPTVEACLRRFKDDADRGAVARWKGLAPGPLRSLLEDPAP